MLDLGVSRNRPSGKGTLAALHSRFPGAVIESKKLAHGYRIVYACCASFLGLGLEGSHVSTVWLLLQMITTEGIADETGALSENSRPLASTLSPNDHDGKPMGPETYT